MISGIGTDIVRIQRMADNLDRYGERFAARILTEAEMVVAIPSYREAERIAYPATQAAQLDPIEALRRE